MTVARPLAAALLLAGAPSPPPPAPLRGGEGVSSSTPTPTSTPTPSSSQSPTATPTPTPAPTSTPTPTPAQAPAPAPTSTGTSTADPYAATMAAARAAFAQREDRGLLAEACGRLSLAASLAPKNPEPLLLLARAHAFRAQAWPADAVEAWRASSAAAERALGVLAPGFGERAGRGEPSSSAAAAVERAGAEALYWLGLATLGMGQARGVAALLAVKDESHALLARAAALDEQVDHGGPRRALGTLLATVPSAAGGGAAAARVELERAGALAPDYQLTRVRDAEVLAVLLQDGARFDALLREVLAYDPERTPDIAPENRLAQRLARELQKRRDRLF
jgi:TRAP transporter TatT component family protein